MRPSLKHPAKLPATLQRSLSLYALAATSAGVQLSALTQPAEAEVIYTPAHTFIGQNQSFSIDLNHDGVNDFTISNRYVGPDSTFIGCHLDVKADLAGGIAYKFSLENSHLAALVQKGQKIDFTAHDARGYAVMQQIYFLYGTGHYSTGYWRDVNNGYLGLAFKIDGQIHLGWARLDVKTIGPHLTRILTLITGYAYETQPNTPIIAGDTGANVDADKESQIEPVNEAPELQEAHPAVSLGALSLGAPGLSIWRRPGF